MTIAPSGSRNWLDEIRPAMRDVSQSGIVEVFDYGRGRQGLIPLWVGEGDLPTPDFIADAAKASMEQGETFYTAQAGIPDFRRAVAAYMTRAYGAGPDGAPFRPERFFATIGGMHAIEIAMRLLVGPGDEVLIPSPAWPNFVGAVETAGARSIAVLLDQAGRWSLDPAKLDAAVTPATRAIVFNSPANPTGFIASLAEIAETLAVARRHNLWIVADEVYGRLTYDGKRAPSFHDVMAPDDKILFVQTLSKNWAMTGFRIGWLEAPPELGPAIENLVQFTSSGSPVFTQRAAIAALDQGEDFLAFQIDRWRQSRDALTRALAATGRVRFFMPEGAFYLFFTVDGYPDSRTLAFRLIDEAGVGPAPGSAFGPGGEGWLRLCFGRDPAQMEEAGRRMAAWLRR